MGYGIGQPKAGCNTCNLNTQACPGTSELPNPTEGLTGNNYNGFTQTDSNGNVIQVQNIIQGGFRPQDYLMQVTENTQPLFRQMVGKYSALSMLLFDYDMLLEDNEFKKTFDLDFKPLFKNFKEAPVMLSNDGYSFIFTERRNEMDAEAYVLLDATNTNQVVLHDGYGNPINLEDIKYKGLFEVGGTVYITSNGNNLANPEDPDCCAQNYWRVIVDITTTNIGGLEYPTLTFETRNDASGTPITLDFKGYNVNSSEIPNTVISSLNDEFGNLYKGDSVMFAYRSRNQCEIISGDFNSRGDFVKRSFIQFTQRRIKFFQNELNISYANKEGAMGFIGRKIGDANRFLITEIAKAFYLGENRAPNSGASFMNPQTGEMIKAGPTTMGILPQIMQANIENPGLGLITSMKDLRTPEDKAKLIVDQIMKVQLSGVVGQGEIFMLMDNKAYSTYMALNPAFTRLMGAEFVVTQNTTKEFTIPVIKTPYGSVSVMSCPMFTHITHNSGNILFIPRDLVMITQRENESYDLTTGNMVKAKSLGLRVYDVTSNLEKPTGCYTYNVTGEFAIILGMVNSGAYRWIQNVQ